MDWRLTTDPAAIIADIIAALSLTVSVFALWRGRKDAQIAGQKRDAWEVAQEQRQLLLTEPGLVPIGARLHTQGMPQRLIAANDQSITVHNEGGSAPSNLRAVLFPSATYIRPGDTLPQQRTRGLEGVYWVGAPIVAPSEKSACPIDLKHKMFPLTGSLCVVEGVTLFAPDEPDIYASLTEPARFYCARLTLTYQDRVRRTLAVVYDLDAATSEWKRIAGPVEVPLDLDKLAAQEEQRRQPPRLL